MKNMYYQYHESGGYKAKVTIEWEIPNNVDAKRLNSGAEIADKILEFSGPKTRDIVQAMRDKYV